ncbi:uncharacterized protein IL334_004315 [Kwoniella shivajii]|uniref:NmrA-like domain-containing protein n=1 Tax=Kwoniella shivajii TaxID=564305 RepID=A0ABZ1CZZ4_9TREE|nr:hypothetical protein IL334_004315 [Kwoniella shivajii]
MSNKDKTIVVFTATGAQGGSVVEELLKGGYKVIGLTRNVEGQGAKGLKSKGVEVATADLKDVDTYKDSLKGAHGAFVNADFWTIFKALNYDVAATAKEEFRQATEAMKACKDAGIKHVVYSTLDDKTEAAHWQSKSDASDWAYKNNIPITNLYMTAYWENISNFKMIQGPKDDGTYTFGLPMPDNTKHAGVPVSQTGLWVKTAFDNPDKWISKDMYAVTGDPTIAEMAATLSEISGKKVEPLHMTKKAFNSEETKKQLGEEMWDNWNLFVENRITRDPKASMENAPGAMDFKAWAKQDKGVKEALGF